MRNVVVRPGDKNRYGKYPREKPYKVEVGIITFIAYNGGGKNHSAQGYVENGTPETLCIPHKKSPLNFSLCSAG